jgi:hypothetical protein
MKFRGPILAPLALSLLLMLAAGPASAVTVFVENIFGRVPDMDGIFEGDSDAFVEVFIDGVPAGTTPIAYATNNPSWPTFSCSLPMTPSGTNTPLVTVELRVWDAEALNVPPEYIGVVTLLYGWQPGLPVTASGQIVGFPSDPSHALTATIRVELDPVPTESLSWGAVKARHGG